MTKSEREKLNSGCTQSSSDPRKFTDANGNSHINIGSNRTQFDNKVVYGYSEANKEKNKK